MTSLNVFNASVFYRLSLHPFFVVHEAQHDDVEPNLKKILHRNGIWGLEAIVM